MIQYSPDGWWFDIHRVSSLCNNKYYSTFLQITLGRFCRSIWVMLITSRLIVNMRCLIILHKWNGVKWQIATRRMINKATRRMINKATRRMINKATRRMIIMYPTDDQFKHPLTVTTQSHASSVCKRNVAAYSTGFLRTKKHYHFHAIMKIFKDAGIE